MIGTTYLSVTLANTFAKLKMKTLCTNSTEYILKKSHTFLEIYYRLNMAFIFAVDFISLPLFFSISATGLYLHTLQVKLNLSWTKQWLKSVL